MAKAKVPLYGNVAKSVFVDPEATKGATVGADLLLPNGAIATREALIEYLGIEQTSGSASQHRLLQGLTVGNDHPQYTRKDTLTTRGDLYRRGATTVERVALGANKRVLRSDGTDPVWTQLSPVITLGTDLSGNTTLTDLESATLNATIVDNAVTNAKLRDSAALSVIGRATNSSGDPADIVAGSNDTFLQRVGGALAFGQLTINMIPDDLITDAKLNERVALSVMGRASNSGGNPADIAAGSNDTILRRVSNALDFGQLTVGMFPNDVVTYAKIQNVSATSRVLGRATAGSGDIEELTLSQVLDLVGSAANGDILYRSGGVWTRLPIGSNTHVLTVSGGLPTWAAGGGGGGSPGGSDGQVQYNNGGAFGGISVFTYDDGAGTLALTPNAIDITTTGGMLNLEVPAGLGRDATIDMSVSPSSLVEIGAETTNIYGDTAISLLCNTLAININLMGSGTIELQGEVDFDNGGTATPGAAGGAYPLPSNPAGYLYIKVQGSDYLMPFYNR